MQFSLDRKQRRHKQNQCSASDSVGLIFTRSYRSTLLIATPTTTPSLVKTSLKSYDKDNSFTYADPGLPAFNVIIEFHFLVQTLMTVAPKHFATILQNNTFPFPLLFS